MQLTIQDIAELTRLEEGMWIASSRYDPTFQSERFAVDFMEFGRSGRIYSRAQTIFSEKDRQEIRAKLPLDGLSVRFLDGNTVQLTYNSHVEHDGVVEHARRSSIWTRERASWIMRFHQGTPYEPSNA